MKAMRSFCLRVSLLTLILFSFCYDIHAYKTLLSRNPLKKNRPQQKNSVKLSALPYSATELSNLKIITEKKLGAKLGQEYLLVAATIKASQSRSEILDCIPQNESLAGDEIKKLKVKIVKEQDRFDREFKNYQVQIPIYSINMIFDSF